MHMTRSLRVLLPLFLLLGSGAIAAAQSTLPTVASGRIERLEGQTPTPGRAREVLVWLPDGYPEAAPYAVLYMPDGQMLFDATITWNRQEWRVDEVAGELIASGRVRPFIVVAIANAGPSRAAEYLPQKPFLRLDDDVRRRLRTAERDQQPFLAEPVYSDRYLAFLVDELKPEVDRRYATDAGPEATALMGSSMGGLVSLYGLIEYPQVFGAAACLSTHWPGSFLLDDPALPEALLAHVDAALPAAGQHRIYFDHGTATLDAHYGAWQRRVDAIMTARGYTAGDWQSRVFEGAAHDERAWSARLAEPLEFLFARRH